MARSGTRTAGVSDVLADTSHKSFRTLAEPHVWSAWPRARVSLERQSLGAERGSVAKKRPTYTLDHWHRYRGVRREYRCQRSACSQSSSPASTTTRAQVDQLVPWQVPGPTRHSPSCTTPARADTTSSSRHHTPDPGPKSPSCTTRARESSMFYRIPGAGQSQSPFLFPSLIFSCSCSRVVMIILFSMLLLTS